MSDAPPPPAAPAADSPTALTLALGGISAVLGATMLYAVIDANKDANASTAGKVVFVALPVLVAMAGMLAFITGALRTAMAGANHRGPVLPVIAGLLENINKNVCLSDAVKRMHHRHQDLALIRQTIGEDIIHKRHESALSLIKELADTYGHIEEAEEFRARVNDSRAAEHEEKAQKAIEQLDVLLDAGDFEKGIPLSKRIQRTFPDSVKAQNLDQRVQEAVNTYKVKLEGKFRAAAEHEDVDLAMDLLKQLDRYLTPQEAAPLVEIARSVIHKKKDNLTVRFKLALHDKEWATALQVGEQIIREFPNGQAAKDVKRHLDVLRDRAKTAQRMSQSGA